MAKKYVYSFGRDGAEGNKDMKDTLGGKGANLAEMCNTGVPVPPGFTVSTEVCNIYFNNNRQVPTEVDDQIRKALGKVEKELGKKLGDPKNPLLMSVRSGAKFSMPGMMNTILNLGLNDETTDGLARLTDNPRFAYDCYRRFIQMFGEVALGIEMEEFDHIFDARKAKVIELRLAPTLKFFDGGGRQRLLNSRFIHLRFVMSLKFHHLRVSAFVQGFRYCS